MPDFSEWEVKLAISGPIAVSRNLQISVEKGHLPFMTTVKLKNVKQGVEAEVIAIAKTPEEANDVAVYFVGQMLDVLSLRLDLPLYLSLFSPEFRPLNMHVKRRVEEREWREVFRLGRDYGMHRSTFSRALSWYRKGLISEDPIDKLIALWLSLEVVGSKYAHDNERTRKGSKNKVLDCFDQLWGTTDKWKIIPNNSAWIDKIYTLRNHIAHGAMPVDVEAIKEITSELPKLRELAHTFLIDWESQGGIVKRTFE